MAVDDSQPERCTATRKDGSRCNGIAIDGHFCFAHSPKLAEARRAGSIKGGHGKHRINRLRRLMPADLAGTFDALQVALQEVHDGDLKPAQASAMASLAGALCKVLETGELVERVEDLESRLTGERRVSP